VLTVALRRQRNVPDIPLPVLPQHSGQNLQPLILARLSTPGNIRLEDLAEGILPPAVYVQHSLTNSRPDEKAKQD
jgi:hypothetical protein